MSLDSIITTPITLGQFLLCAAAALVLGFVMALVYLYKNTSSRGFVATLVLLPVAVQTVILLVNGNLGIGVAVAGAFSLVRFRSVAGTAKEITALFLAMAIGLACGTGYLMVAALFTVIVSLVFLGLTYLNFGAPKQLTQTLKITVPESLDYTGLFDDILSRSTRQWDLISVHTTNMGSLYELNYQIVLTNGVNSRDFIDQLRTRNGNLKISLGQAVTGKNAKEEL